MITPGKRCKSGKGRFLLAHALAFCLALNLLGHAVPRAAHAGSWTQVQYWSNEDLVDVAAGPGNTVYVATLQGVRKWAAGSWTNLGKPQYLSGILVTPAGELWARGNYIYWGYVYRWAGGTSWSCVLSSDSLNIYDIDVDPSGKVWLGCSDGRLRYWNGSSFLSTAQWPHGSSPIQRIAFAADGTLWAGGQSGRVARWTGSAWTDAGQLPSAYSDTVAMAVDNKGQPVVVGAGWSDDSWYSVSYRRADGS
ncbi:MAG: WD40 repeat domain-containing protein, partial [Firmicutes bacterium]|nr:WD40 repeat domain-containing protein [Bacillota bacterium]